MPNDMGRTSMGAKTEALARQFEGKARDALATLEKLGDTDWKKVTAAEKWTVVTTSNRQDDAEPSQSDPALGLLEVPPAPGSLVLILNAAFPV
jgi:hypothetical protein